MFRQPNVVSLMLGQLAQLDTKLRLSRNDHRILLIRAHRL